MYVSWGKLVSQIIIKNALSTMSSSTYHHTFLALRQSILNHKFLYLIITLFSLHIKISLSTKYIFYTEEHSNKYPKQLN
jgi:hypothetical protein